MEEEFGEENIEEERGRGVRRERDGGGKTEVREAKSRGNQWKGGTGNND